MRRSLVVVSSLVGIVTLAAFNYGSTARGLGFVAPQVQGNPSSYVANPHAGEIVFQDTGSAGNFYGYNGTDWEQLNGDGDSLQNVVTKTSGYTLTGSDDVVLVDASGGSFTLSLPSATTNTGKSFVIKKIDSSTDYVTIDPNSTETIDGDSTTTVNTRYESITLVSDGSNWNLVDRTYPMAWSTFTPTGSWSSNTTYTGRWRRVGDSMEVSVNVALSGAPTATTLTVSLPSGYSIDTGKMELTSAKVLGHGLLRDSGTDDTLIGVEYAGTTTVHLRKYQGAQVSHNSPITFAGGDSLNFIFRVPISGWN